VVDDDEGSERCGGGGCEHVTFSSSPSCQRRVVEVARKQFNRKWQFQ
jgi:hypothetical protein